MKIALDVESVLAEPNGAVAEATERLTKEEIEETWFSDDEEDHAYQIYMGVSDAIWRHNPMAIPPEEPNLDEYVDAIRESATVDILTHRQHVDEQVKFWLAEHGIHYDEFISTDRPKCDFDYDHWIDDNPNMVGGCSLFLRHQPWNADVSIENLSSCERVHSLHDVVRKI